MRSVFVGYFRPKDDELSQMWSEGIFVVDANVLLNLYRYSSGTRKELEKALEVVKDRIFIPHQAAKEFLGKRLDVTAGQANEYAKAIKSINDLLTKLSSKDRHPFLPDAELPEFESYSQKLILTLESQQKLLFDKFSNDEILDFVENLFSSKTGSPYEESVLAKLAVEGEERYKNKVPPGYMDSNKDGLGDQYRKYGDFLIWKQIIEYSKSQSKPVIFITDDKKEDWWVEQSGRTIGPRPELIEEFYKDTSQKFWMYSVGRFVQESAKATNEEISEEVISELIKVSQDSVREAVKASQDSVSDDVEIRASISVSQETIETPLNRRSGLLIVTLNKSMHYATGTGKFTPRFKSIPTLTVDLVSAPYKDKSTVNIRSGCGTVKDFNVHLKAISGELEAGDYVFKYEAVEQEDANFV
jgi:predicted nucleic acid-binding protein